MDKSLNIKIDDDVKLLCISDIHEHPDQFLEIINKFPISDKMRLVVCGDVFDKGFGFPAAERIINKIKYYIELGHAYMIKGNHELKNIKKNRKNGNLVPIFKWVESLPISLSFVYDNSVRYTIVHAGVDGHMRWYDLNYDLNICYIRYLSNATKKIASMSKEEVNGKTIYKTREADVSSWHDIYDGRFGYIISGHNNDPSGPKFYRYSCNIDTGVFNSGILTAVVFGSQGREQVYQATGKAFNEQVAT